MFSQTIVPPGLENFWWLNIDYHLSRLNLALSDSRVDLAEFDDPHNPSKIEAARQLFSELNAIPDGLTYQEQLWAYARIGEKYR